MDRSTTELGFQVFERVGDDTEFTLVDTVGYDSTAILLSERSGDVSYTYRIRAFNSYGASDWSNVTLVLDPAMLMMVEAPAGSHGNYTGIAISPDSRFLAAGTNMKNLYVWELETGSLLQTLEGQTGLSLVAFSPDGYYLASSGGLGEPISIWSVPYGEHKITIELDEQDRLYSLAFHPDGRILAAAVEDSASRAGNTGTMVKLWEYENGLLIKEIRGLNQLARSLEFSPDGRYMAAGLADSTVKIWHDYILQNPLTEHSRGVSAVSFSPDSRKLASAASDSTIRVWNVDDSRLLLTIQEDVADLRSVDFSPDGLYLASGNAMFAAKIWNSTTGELLNELETVMAGAGDLVVCSSDGNYLATAAFDGIRLWRPFR